MKRNLSLYLSLQSTTTKNPQYKLLVNEVEVDQVPELVSIAPFKNEHRYDISLDYVDTIKVVFFGKEEHDTKIDNNGKIVEDLFLTIEKFSIDNFDFLSKLSKISTYRGNNGSMYNTFNYMSFNGTITIKIHKNILYTDWLSSIV